MKPFSVDVPVMVNIWIRPECQRRQFDIIKQARPSKLFLISDGGRSSEEWEAINSNRAIFENEIDWDCQVFKLYETENNGLYGMGAKAVKFVWSNVDRCIFLEDDILPSVSFFRYCAELLEYYKNDTRVCVICGMNHLGTSPEVSSDYFFSRQGSIWGTATWKRVHESQKIHRGGGGLADYYSDPYIRKLLRQRTKHDHDKRVWEKLQGYGKDSTFEGHVAGSEFFYDSYLIYVQNQLQIIPKVNLVSNIGATSNSAHMADLSLMPESMQRLFNMKTYEIEFPLKHAKFVIPDAEYQEKRDRIMARNHPFINFYRKLGRARRVIAAGDFKELFVKGKRYLYRNILKKKIAEK